MSVTFFAATNHTADLRVFRLTCEDGTVLGDYTGYSNAYSEAQAHKLVCADSLCQDYGAGVDEVATDATPLGVNLNGRNAYEILRLLGHAPAFGEEPAGQLPARKMIDLVGTVLAVGVTDRGLDPIDLGRAVECGRLPGHLTRRLREISELAEKCLTLGVDVAWG